MYFQIFAILIVFCLSFIFTYGIRKKKHFNPFVFLLFLSAFLLIAFLIFRSHKSALDLIVLSNTLSLIALMTGVFFKSIKKKLFAFICSLLFGCICFLWWHGYLDPLIFFAKQYHLKLGSSDISLWSFLQSIALLSISIWVAHIISKKVDFFIGKFSVHASLKILFSKFFKVFIFFTSLLWGLSLIGVDISVFAFFGGAIALGVGFGLQNIVSNLICGIILLIDKSIKPNDVIALKDGQIIGVVHKLTARYVALRTQEGKEHLVPNDYFVTHKVENWSYSDRLIRVDLSLKVPFDSDLDEITNLFYQAAALEKRALKIPAPSVRLSKIIENAIEIQLRVWIADPEKGVSEIKSNLIYEIWKLFKLNGIQVPYLPIDVFIRQDPIKTF
jgi:small-conductance mechanosensitive channel